VGLSRVDHPIVVDRTAEWATHGDLPDLPVYRDHHNI
jgi:hypothetical protein